MYHLRYVTPNEPIGFLYELRPTKLLLPCRKNVQQHTQLQTCNSYNIAENALSVRISSKMTSDTTTKSVSPGKETDTRNSNNIYVVLYDYAAQHEDELDLVKCEKVKVLSKDFKISGDEGWWTGLNLRDNKRGIFPFNYVGTASQLTKEVVAQSISSSIRTINKTSRSDSRELPPHISFNSLEFKDCIGAGGFGKVYRGFWLKMHDERQTGLGN